MFQAKLSEYFQSRQFNLVWTNDNYETEMNISQKTEEDIFNEIKPLDVIYANLEGEILYYSHKHVPELPKIIGLRGKMGCGKDTFALFLRQYAKTYDIRRFSYGLRVGTSILTGIRIENTWSDIEKQQLVIITKDNFIAKVRHMILAVMEDNKERDWDLLASICWTRLCGEKDKICLTLGKLLQLLGTEFFRNCIDKDVFVNYLDRHWDHKIPLIITDVRNINEMEYVKVQQGKIILILREEATRKDGRDPSHYSECALNELKPDVIIENDKGLIEFESQAFDFIGSHDFEKKN